MNEPNQLLASLAQHPAWKELAKVLDDRMDKEFGKLAYEFALRDKQPDYGQLQYVRGFMAGMKFLWKEPTLEATKLAKALAKERDE